MMAQVTAAALASDNKTLAHPDSVDSIPTSASQEDHVSMATNAALHAREIIWNVERIVAIEMLCAAQGLDYRLAGREYAPQRIEGGRVRYEWAAAPKQQPGLGVAAAYTRLRQSVATLAGDRPLAPDIEAVSELVHSGDMLPTP
jgi:histidine ammonia-lyase